MSTEVVDRRERRQHSSNLSTFPATVKRNVDVACHVDAAPLSCYLHHATAHKMSVNHQNTMNLCRRFPQILRFQCMYFLFKLVYAPVSYGKSLRISGTTLVFLVWQPFVDILAAILNYTDIVLSCSGLFVAHRMRHVALHN